NAAAPGLCHLKRDERGSAESEKTEFLAPLFGPDADTFERPIADHASAKKRSRIQIGEALWNRKNHARPRGRVSGESAVAIPSREMRIPTKILPAGSTQIAFATSFRQPAQSDALSVLQRVYACPEFYDATHDLMPGDDRKLMRR